ncbi:uncharacterized protein V5649_016345 [Rhynchonycteris naso]
MGRRHRRSEQGAAGGVSRQRQQRGEAASQWPEAASEKGGGGREDTKTVSECRLLPQARGRSDPGQRGSCGRGPTGGEPSCTEQRPAARISARRPPGQSISAPHCRPARPSPANPRCPHPRPSCPIGCERESAGLNPSLAGPKTSAPAPSSTSCPLCVFSVIRVPCPPALGLLLIGGSRRFYPVASPFTANHICRTYSGRLVTLVSSRFGNQTGIQNVVRSRSDGLGRYSLAPGGIQRQLCEAPAFLFL